MKYIYFYLSVFLCAWAWEFVKCVTSETIKQSVRSYSDGMMIAIFIRLPFFASVEFSIRHQMSNLFYSLLKCWAENLFDSNLIVLVWQFATFAYIWFCLVFFLLLFLSRVLQTPLRSLAAIKISAPYKSQIRQVATSFPRCNDYR